MGSQVQRRPCVGTALGQHTGLLTVPLTPGHTPLPLQRRDLRTQPEGTLRCVSMTRK